MVCAMAWLASDHLREVAGSGTDFTGLFFIVTWINAIAVRLWATVSSAHRASLSVVKVRQMLVISRDALPAIVSHAAADRFHTGRLAACDRIGHERRARR